MAYSELIKSFERIRSYMREFFVYGFKSRSEFSSKSARSYDNERRRIESWMGDYMSFRQTDAGKNVFLSVDSRDMEQNPLFAAFRAKSFTDNDITLYFFVMDILRQEQREQGPMLAAAEIHDRIAADYLHPLGSDLELDLSTVRKKLKEFEALGLIRGEKAGNRILYCIAEDPLDGEPLPNGLRDALHFFSEEAPLGVIGTYIAEKYRAENAACGHTERRTEAGKGPLRDLRISHKHHYILDVLDSEIMLGLLRAIRDHRRVEVHALSRKGREFVWNLIPVKIFISTQHGRYYLVGYSDRISGFDAVRIDHIQKVVVGDRCGLHAVAEGERSDYHSADHAGSDDKGKDDVLITDYDSVLKQYEAFRKHLWGVSFGRHYSTIHMEVDVRAGAGEEFIVERLRREKRCGQVMQVSEDTWRYSADVYDTLEMLPWVRTFTGRIVRLVSDDGELEERFYEDLGRMRWMYAADTAGHEEPGANVYSDFDKPRRMFDSEVKEKAEAVSGATGVKTDSGSTSNAGLLFHEIYGSYFETVSRILTEASGMTEKRLLDIVSANAFAESTLVIPEKLKNGDWPLLMRKEGTYDSILSANPGRPLTLLEKEWLKAILLDPRIRLFFYREEDQARLKELERQLADVRPLYGQTALDYFDRYADGDDYTCETYVRHFRMVLRAICEGRTIYVKYNGRRGSTREQILCPYGIEYSSKDDKFRVLCGSATGTAYTINMSRIRVLDIKRQAAREERVLPRIRKCHVDLELTDERNALQRAMLHFSDLQKETEKIDERHYKIRLFYYRDDETEIVIRVLAFGPMLRVLAPERFAGLIWARIEKQERLCGL